MARPSVRTAIKSERGISPDIRNRVSNVGDSVWEPHAPPRVLAMAPSPSRDCFRSDEDCFGEGAKTQHARRLRSPDSEATRVCSSLCSVPSRDHRSGFGLARSRRDVARQERDAISAEGYSTNCHSRSNAPTLKSIRAASALPHDPQTNPGRRLPISHSLRGAGDDEP